MSEALILAGHGSHLDPNSSAPVHAHARRLRATGRFAEVRVAFWKEEPALSRAFDGLEADSVTVVPVFMADGYFTQQVIPREMGLGGTMTTIDGRCVRYTAPVGTSAAMTSVVLARAAEEGAAPDSALALLGHGTPRNPKSDGTVYEQVERLRALGRFRDVFPVFLDQEPNMRDIESLTGAGRIVIVPYFVADGWHAGQEIPAELGIERGHGRLAYAGAVGTHPLVAEVILALANEAKSKEQGPKSRRLAAPPLPRSRERGPGGEGELRIHGPEGAEIVLGPGKTTHELVADEDALLSAVRFDSAGRYRPLPGARSLPGGWQVQCGPELPLASAVEAVYPLAATHRRLFEEGRLTVVSLEDVLARQSGRYAIAAALPYDARETAADVLCGRCVKSPAWRGAGCGTAGIPCPEPCSVLVALCREAALWEAAPPEPAIEDDSRPWAAFDQPGNEVREEYIRLRFPRSHGVELGNE
jgi:sirohydrochlorin cobaltochelatase